MPKPRKNPLIQCPHYKWRLIRRESTWYADGRSNTPPAGRHSLGTTDKEEAQRLLAQLDRRIAEQRGLVPRAASDDAVPAPLDLEFGRKLYEQYLARPRSVGGPKASTRKRYRTVFDKFLRFARSQGVDDWQLVDGALLAKYAGYLESLSRRPKTQRNELVVLVQTIRWLIVEGHLVGKEPVRLKFGRVESQRGYCWRKEEVRRIVQFCQADHKLQWLGDVVTALAFTGLRISELVALRWADIDIQKRMLHLPDETGYGDAQGLELRERKSGRSRSFPIHQDIIPVLLRQPRSNAHVFLGPRGGRLKPDYVRHVLVSKVIEPLAKEFPTDEGARGFRDGRLHSFRHYFCSMCANDNVPIMMVMEWLGHADSGMVRYYYHLYDSESRRHMDRLDPLGDKEQTKLDVKKPA